MKQRELQASRRTTVDMMIPAGSGHRHELREVELVKDVVKIGRFVPVIGSVIVIVEGTVAAGKHGVYMIGLVADGDFSGAANAHTAYMLSSAASISGNFHSAIASRVPHLPLPDDYVYLIARR